MENFSADRHPSLPPVMPAQKKTPGSSHTDLFERVASEEAHEHAIQKGDVCMMHPTLVMSSSNIDDRRLEMAGGIPYRVADVADGNLTVLVESIPATELPPVKVSREAVIAASQHHIFAHGNRDFRYILYGKPLPTNNSECGLFFESVRLVVHKISDVDGAPRLTMAADIWLTDLFYVEEHQRQPSGQEKKIWTSYTIASYLAPNPLSLAIPKKCTIAPNMWKVILVCAGGDHEGYDHFSFKSDSPPSIKVFKIDDFIRQFIVTGYEALGGFSEIKPAAACLRTCSKAIADKSLRSKLAGYLGTFKYVLHNFPLINELKFTEYDTFALSFANHEAMTNAMTSVFSDIYAEMQGPSDLIAQFLMGQHNKTVPEKVHAPPVSAPTPPATRKKPTPSKVKLLPNEEVPGTTSEAANDDSDFVPPTKSSTAEHEDTKMLAKKYPGIKMTPSEKKNPVRSLYRAKEQLMQLKETHEEQVKILKQQLLTANNQLKHLQKALRDSKVALEQKDLEISQLMDKMSKVNELAKDKAAEANAAKQANDAENTKGMFTSVLKEILPEIVGALSKRDEQVTNEWTHALPNPEHANSDPPLQSASPHETPTSAIRGRGPRPSTTKKSVTARKRPVLEKSRKDEVLQHERARPQRMNVSPPDPEPFEDEEPVPVVKQEFDDAIEIEDADDPVSRYDSIMMHAGMKRPASSSYPHDTNKRRLFEEFLSWSQTHESTPRYVQSRHQGHDSSMHFGPMRGDQSFGNDYESDVMMDPRYASGQGLDPGFHMGPTSATMPVSPNYQGIPSSQRALLASASSVRPGLAPASLYQTTPVAQARGTVHPWPAQSNAPGNMSRPSQIREVQEQQFPSTWTPSTTPMSHPTRGQVIQSRGNARGLLRGRGGM